MTSKQSCKNLLEGDLKIDDTNYQYLGNNLDIEELKNDKQNTKSINLKIKTSKAGSYALPRKKEYIGYLNKFKP